MRVLVGVVPVAGHVGPVSAVVAELVRRGHRVRVHTGALFRHRFTGLGAGVVPWTAAQDFDADDLAATFPEAAGSQRREVMTLIKRGFLGTAPGQVRDLQDALALESADLLVSDSMCLGPGLVAELSGLPWATVNVLPFNPSLDGPFTTVRVPHMSGSVGRLRDAAVSVGYRVLTSPFRRIYQRVRRDVGLPYDHRPYGAGFLSEQLVVATGCPGLEPRGAGIPEWVQHVGHLGLVGAEFSPSPPLRPGRTLVLVSQGTIDTDPSELLQPALRGLADLDLDVLATTGHIGRDHLGVPVPANAQIRDVVDYTVVLPSTSVFVTNGGWGGVLSALAAGVPVVVAPGRAADKPEIAARVAAAGVGVDLRRRRPTAEAVAAAVRTVLADPGFARRSAALAEELSALGGVARAGSLLEGLAGSPTVRGSRS
ncbi:MAG TPA: nucleotide disphospho-sugar-binding domain-containing protein [Microlunatus sp.]